MKTRELFLKDPLTWTLLNEGVSSNNSADLDTLRYELQTFVCQGEYYTGLVRMLQGAAGWPPPRIMTPKLPRSVANCWRRLSRTRWPRF